MNLRDIYNKYKDIIPYAVFGVLTTVVNIVVYWICAHLLYMPVVLSTAIAWILSVLFAYVTNRKWVFHSMARGQKAIMIELASFFACRMVTGFFDLACMYILVDYMKLNDVIIKTASNIVVIILNYVASKLVIFRSGSKEK